ncbi:SRPBCC family protein [Micromonospora parva]|uniref:SRPBCC family protein n=1 Tax=Micromonospora TaxID=1873 RepID=UPI0027DD16B4|nr:MULTISPECIES: SRPBCC family protein [unclassified Micromonospora]
MPSAEKTVQIGRTPEVVFAFLARGENDARWRPNVLDVARVSGEGVGARYRQGLKGPGGSRIPADYEVTGFEPGRRLAFQATGSVVRTQGEYTLTPADGGGTKLTLKLAWQPSGLSRFLGPVVGRTFEEEIAALDALRDLLESEA